ncbi:MAG: ABC transporter ATP-binding protein [Chlamydiia bacterium]|nr:ABC transporter ATP-binding protein [Chlamydiia bacterium]
MDNPILTAENIHKTFHEPVDHIVLDGVFLEVFPGDAVAIMGRSGEGKSTLLQILGTLESPSSGTLTICGQKVSYFSVDRIRSQNIAFVFQSYHLMEDYTVIENILMPAKIARNNTAPGSESYANAMELLELVGLTDHAHYNAKLLSGGEKQRVAIARALCNDPDIILADEPSGNLDSKTSEHIHQLLMNFAQKKGKAIIIVTHNKNLASLCNKRYMLENGVLTDTSM